MICRVRDDCGDRFVAVSDGRAGTAGKDQCAENERGQDQSALQALGKSFMW